MGDKIENFCKLFAHCQSSLELTELYFIVLDAVASIGCQVSQNYISVVFFYSTCVSSVRLPAWYQDLWLLSKLHGELRADRAGGSSPVLS